MSVLTPNVAIKRQFMGLAFVLAAIATGGCPFIIPTPGLEPSAPAAKVMQTIKPHVTTRTDMLMTLGDPNFRLEDDRYFVYDWTDHKAIAGVGIGYLAYAVDVADLRALAIEFTPDGRVARLKEFARSTNGEAERELWGDIRVWMKAANGGAR